MNFKQLKDQYRWVLANEKSSVINIPDEIGEVLLNIPAQIEEKKKANPAPNNGKGKNVKKGGEKKNQQKLTNFFAVKGDPLQEEDSKNDESFEQTDPKPSNQPIRKQANFFATDRVRFSWIIQLNNIYIAPKFQKDPFLTLNYVMHTVLFPYISFERTKKIIARTPIALIVPKEFQSNTGVMEVNDQNSKGQHNSGLKVGSLRLEYSSVHMKDQSLCFSPNNMKLVIDKQVPIGVFWTVVLDETNQCNNCYLHWIVNEAIFFQPLEAICKDAKNMNELFKGLEDLLGKDNEALQYTRRIYQGENVV